MAPRLVVALALVALAPTVAGAQNRSASPRAARSIRMGERYLAAGDRGSAVAYFREAIAADPYAARAYADLAALYRARNAFFEARRVYEAGLSRVPGDATLWLGLARTLDALGQLGDAARAVRSLLARDPDNLQGLGLQAELARRRGAWSEALAAYRRLIASGAVDETSAADARRYEAALRILARPLDPVSAPRACVGSPLRRALAHCR